MIEPAPSPPPPRNMVLDPPLAEAHYLEWWGGACRVIEGASPNIEGLEPPNVWKFASLSVRQILSIFRVSPSPFQRGIVDVLLKGGTEDPSEEGGACFPLPPDPHPPRPNLAMTGQWRSKGRFLGSTDHLGLTFGTGKNYHWFQAPGLVSAPHPPAPRV